MKQRLIQRITQTTERLTKTRALRMKELEVYGALTLGVLIFLFIIVRLLF